MLTNKNNSVRVIFEKGASAELQDLKNRELEPQALKIRAQNNATIFLDVSERGRKDLPPVDIRLSSRNNTLFLKDVVRMAVSDFFLVWVTPNINIRNNVIRFFSSVTGQIHISTIPEGFYNTRVAMIDALVIALNSPTVNSGILFAGSPDTLNPTCATITGDFTFRFDITSSMIVKGEPLFNISQDQSLTLTKKVGSINGQYTKHVSIFSRQLNQWRKNPNTSNTGGTNTLLFRLGLENQLGIPGFQEEIVQNLVWFNFKPDQTLSDLDFTLRDQFGEILYIPSCGGGSEGFDWGINLITET